MKKTPAIAAYIAKLPVLLLVTLLGGTQNLWAVPNPSGYSRQATSPASEGTKPYVLLGLYAEHYLGDQKVIDRELRQVDEWTGKRHSLAGLFMDIDDSNPNYNIGMRLERLRKNGYTAFINLDSTRTMAEIAQGNLDNSLRKLAKAYVKWSGKGEGRMAYIAPLQEMNIAGESYGKAAPEQFKQAYQRIQQIFAEAGVSNSAVRWVFAPNGWSESDAYRFENYYPGSDRVDVVAFSAYNWGYCANSTWRHWEKPTAAFAPYIDRIQKMAPGKAIFIAQTATTSYAQNNFSNNGAKDEWLRETYNYLATAPGVQGILYFNFNKECDWALYDANKGITAGYKEAVANPAYVYLSPSELGGR